MEKQFNVLILCLPESGHINPLICYATELVKSKNIKAIMYSTKEYRTMIEKANIEFREADFRLPGDMHQAKVVRKTPPLKGLINFFMDTTDKFLPELVRCVQDDHIDLIIYDFLTVYAKWFMRHLNYKHKNGQLKRPPPKAIMFSPAVLQQKGIYPNSFEDQFLPKPKFSLQFVIDLLVLLFKYVVFCFRNSLPLENPLHVMFMAKETLNICCIVPEFQPRSHLFPKSCRFVGSCASEEVRGAKEFEEPLKSFLAPFPERNPLPLVNLKLVDSLVGTNSKLIYISLGTVVNNDIESFLRLIEGIKAINMSSSSVHNYKFLMSVGPMLHKKFEILTENKEIEMPENLLIMPRVPQLDVLKRASLFITHSGQGSTSESIHYGVPMVCIPVMGDQPAVAYRVADELGLGIQLNFDTFNAQDVKSAVTTVLNDKSYLERTLLFSQISRKYNGTKEATKLTIEYLQNSSSSTKKID